MSNSDFKLPFPATQQLMSADNWLSQSQVSAQAPAWVIRGLCFDGLMTQAIEHLTGHMARVQPVELTGRNEQAPADHLRRNVIILSAGKTRLIASSLIPAGLLAQHQWLNTLGTAPLGPTLMERLNPKKSEFEFQCLAQPTQTDAPRAAPVWARRFDFLINAHRLRLMEIFHPSFLKLLGHYEAS